ncbi:MAG TPA: 2-oxoglutarate dehydrogenase complex dihydrolipoyllysine-residue succinyltransferase [Verrucomicrobia bacterium]|nr:2-oxoglutarate dehydrogenase complex dihydrolipoyllysine-residue succinyltransferase [Verrucomicrobiota bacterium]HOP96052.1 2-oxoglutarate dehydrogenase complex dihydrolipoyllysine-residue succinyltransferase [Verrucomicrobiota bacterium]
MSIELKVPEIGESITEVEIGDWLKKAGEPVQKDDPLVTLESEKATVELPAPESGTLGKMLKKKGDVAKIGEVIGYLETGKAETAKPEAPKAEAPKPEGPGAEARKPEDKAPKAGAESDKTATDKAALKSDSSKPEKSEPSKPRIVQSQPAQEKPLSQRLAAEPPPAPAGVEEEPVMSTEEAAAVTGGEEEVVPMSRLRRTVAERLVEAQRTAALLTTFNEVDMSAVVALRKEYGEAFQKKFGVKLGFMSFFVKASVDALKQFPVVNAEVRGTDIVYRNYYDIGVAIGGGKGLVVPVLRRAERMSFAEIEMAIGDFARRARENKLKPDELQGGTFTISNGGVYGSLLSTPIVNPPQSGVLGMHAIQDRPVARDGAVVIRPMMYLALTYDHRIVDGREAVSFLKRIKEAVENPTRMLIEV